MMKKLICLLALFFTFYSGNPKEMASLKEEDPVHEVVVKIKGLNNSIDSLNRILDEKGL